MAAITHARKAEVIEAWRRRQKKSARIAGATAQAALPPASPSVLPPTRYHRPPGAGNTGPAQSRRILGSKYGKSWYYRPALPPARYYRFDKSGTTGATVLPPLKTGTTGTVGCVPLRVPLCYSLMYPFVAKTINRTPFPTF